MIEPRPVQSGQLAGTKNATFVLPDALRACSGTSMAILLGLATAVALLPVLVFPLPPLADYPNHLARMHVIATIGSDPDLARYYDIHWQIIPNLVMDVVVPFFARVMDIYHAGQAFTVICCVLVATGVFALNRALFGGWSMSGIVALPLLYNRIFLLGLMNYWFGIGIALWAVAAWVLLRDRPWPWRLSASTLFALALFFSHVFAVGLYGMALLAFELWRLGARRTAPLASRLVDLAATGLPFVPVLALLLASPTRGLAGENEWSLAGKLEGLYFVVSTYSDFLDAALATAMAALLASAALRGEARVHPAGPILLGIGAIVYLAMPNATFTAYLVDERLPIAIVLVAIAFMSVEIPHRLARRRFALALLALLAVRVVEVGVNWSELARQTADVRASTRLIERGARVLVAQSDDVSDNDALDFALAHAGCLAIIERSALVSDVFVFPGKQIMGLRPPYGRLAATTDTDPPSVDDLEGKPPPGEMRLAGDSAPYWRRWRSDYDYVYLMYAADDLVDPVPDVLTPIYAGNRFRLYKIRKPAR